MKLKTFLIIYGLFVASVFLQACSPYGESATGKGIEAVNNGTGDLVIVSAGEDVKGAAIAGDTLPAAPAEGVEDDDGLIFGCSVESEEAGRCSRTPD